MNNELTSHRERIVWIDFAKVIGFLLVVIGHMIITENWVDSLGRGIIFSFHMPLFFMLSFITTSLSDSFVALKRKTIKRAYHLLIPFIIVIFIHALFLIFYEHKDISTFDFWRTFIINKLLGFEGEGYASAGSAWFFFAIFISQTLFDLLHLLLKRDSLLFVISIIFTVLGVIIGYLKVVMPFYLDMVLSSFIFFFIGYKIRSIDLNKYQIERFVICFLIWATTFTFMFVDKIYNSYYEIWLRNYPMFPLSHICAIAGCMTFIYLCIFTCKIKYLGKWIGYFGQYNIIFIIVHTFHQFYFRTWFNFFPTMGRAFNDFINILIGLAISLAIIIIWKTIQFIMIKIKTKKQLVDSCS